MTDCSLKVGINGKLRCETHKQFLMYVYYDKRGHITIVCQVGEEERNKGAK
jgi:hypothetical protein